MPRAFWLFSTNAGDGSEDNPNRPALPVGVGGKMTCPGDIIRLTGPAGPNAHRHLLVGGIALQDDNLDGLTGEGHVHYLLKVGEAWHQITVDALEHTHTLNIGANNNIVPDYFMLFWAGSNADAATIAADPNCFPIVEAIVSAEHAYQCEDCSSLTYLVGPEDNPPPAPECPECGGNTAYVQIVPDSRAIGALDDTEWTAEERTTWENRCLNILGVRLPGEVDRGRRLVLLFLGALLSRHTSDERGYRFG